MELNFDDLKKQWVVAEQSAKLLAEQLNQAKENMRASVIAEIKTKIIEFNFTDDDFEVPKAKKGKPVTEYVSSEGKSPFRYVNLANIASKWTGKGMCPKWLPENKADREAYKIENALARLIAYPLPHNEVVKAEIEMMQRHIEQAKQIDAEKAAKAAAKAESEGKNTKNKESKSKGEDSRIDLTAITYSTVPVATSFVAENPVQSHTQVMGVPSSTGYAA